jgi:hypothetical protein
MIKLRINGKNVSFAKNSITYLSIREDSKNWFDVEIQTTSGSHVYCFYKDDEAEAREIFNKLNIFINQ